MQFTDEELDELRAIYREDFGGEITREQALEIGTRLVNLIDLLRRRPPKRDSAPDSPAP